VEHQFVGGKMVMDDKTKWIKVNKAYIAVCVHDE